ncbi:MAG TPA: hypothetical protein VIQ99_03505 [Gammaproteobacteria bacterium]
MDTTVGTFRELTAMEIAVVSGAFSWGELAGHMLLGAGLGAMAGAAGGGLGAGPGALAGALLGGINYTVGDLIDTYF